MSYLVHLIKHPIAAAAVVAGTCILWTIVYVLLIAWAVVFDQPVGGPLAYPGGLLFLSVASGLASVFIFLPSTVIGKALVAKLQLRAWWGLLISVLLLPAFTFVALWLIELVAPKIAVGITMTNAAILFAICLVPLTGYWLIICGLDWLLGFLPRKPAVVIPGVGLSFVPLLLVAYLVGFMVIFDLSDMAPKRDDMNNFISIGPRPRCCCEPLDDSIHYTGYEWCFTVFSPLVKLYNSVFMFR